MAGADHIAWLHHGAQPARWGNLGLWRAGAAPDYATACRALAQAVGEAAGMRAGDTVLSLGCGAGEELALWAEGFGAASVMALEKSPALAAQARQRAEAVQTGCEIDVYCADASRLSQLVRGRFDRIVCVDAAWDLGARTPLLHAARARLFAGGTFTFTDVALDDGASAGGSAAWRRAALRLGAGLGGFARDGLLEHRAGLARLREAGFDEVQVVRLDEAVLDGFCDFAARQARRIGFAARNSPAWRRVAFAAWLIRAGRGAGLGYALYSGRVRVPQGHQGHQGHQGQHGEAPADAAAGLRARKPVKLAPATIERAAPGRSAVPSRA